MANILLKGVKVYESGVWREREVLIRNGSWEDSGDRVSKPEGVVSLAGNNRYWIPGLVDVHVHLREPGFSYKETIAAATQAAARWGYTALCAMPNLNPAPDTLPHLREELEIIARDAAIPVLPYGCITMGEQGRELADMEAMAPYVCAFSDDGKGVQNDDMMRAAMIKAKALGRMIVAHCEVDDLLHGGYIHDGAYAAAHGHKGICSQSEWRQVERDIAHVRETGCAYHVCHVSTRESVALLRAAKAQGLPVTCETAPHYLVLTQDDLQEDGRFKMNPPLRAREDREALLEGVLDGTIDCIATDHAPHSVQEKSRGLAGSAFGIVGLETTLGVLVEHLVRPGILPLETLVERMAIAPRRIFGIPGGFAQGCPVDGALVDLDVPWTVHPDDFLSLGRATPFAGAAVHGRVDLTICQGSIVWQRGDKNDK